MAFPLDPANDPIARIRLRIGDTDEFDLGLEDAIYQYLLDTYDQNENKAAIEALKMLVAKYANLVTEKAGGLFVKNSERFDHYKQLLDDASNNPASDFFVNGLPFAGGIDPYERVCTKPSTSPFSLGYTARKLTRW